MDDIVLRAYEPGDEHGILASFNLVFREVCGPGYVDRDLTTWRWQFLDNPAGQRIYLAVAKDGVIACQYAGLPVRARTNAGPTVFNQIVDSFVHPRFRQGLKRPGLFVHTALPAMASWVPMGDGLFHGLPVEAARKMSVRMLGYFEWRPIDYLCRDAGSGVEEGPGAVYVRQVHDLGADVDVLAGAIAEEKTCLALRGRDHLAWRYLRCPSACYEVWEARRKDHLVGLCVLRPVHELVAGACTFAELLTLPGDDETIDALVARATARARAQGRRTLMAVFPPHARETRALLARGFVAVPSAQTFYRSIGCRLEQPGFTKDMLEHQWWYSLGDFDLV